MALYTFDNTMIRPLKVTSFEQAKIKERGDLQRLLRDRIDIIVPEGMVLAEEFGDWNDARRRIDLLVLDKEANLVVVELKRTDDGGHMELQAIRYAAMVSTMTFQQAVEAHRHYLKTRNLPRDSKEAILTFLGWEGENEGRFAGRVRIVLASADFCREITTTALWLNERGLDIECIRLKPYEMEGKIVADVQQIIPLPEAEDYIIQVGNKIRAEQSASFRTWDLKSFLHELSKNCSQQIVELAKHIYDWSRQEFIEVRFGHGEERGSFGPKLFDDSQSLFFVVRSDGRFTIRFMHLKTKQWLRDGSVLETFRNKLNEIPGVAFDEEDLGGKPNRALEVLMTSSSLKQFQEAMLWLRDQANAIAGRGSQQGL